MLGNCLQLRQAPVLTRSESQLLPSFVGSKADYDLQDDPHGAALWLDFLAIKTGNGEFLISMLESAQYSPAAERFHAYPGMAYAQALALRADENAKKHGVGRIPYFVVRASECGATV